MTATAVSSNVTPWTEAPPQEKDAVEMVGSCVHSFEEGIGRDFKDRCDHLYRQYRGFKKLRNVWEQASSANDRDDVLKDAKGEWGSNLHVPYAFSTVETMVPRAISQRPGMLFLPREERWEDNAEHLRELIDWQQHQIDVELTWQDIMRSGFIFGLGVGKSFWRQEFAPRREVRPRIFGRMVGQSPYYVSPLQQQMVFDDPDLEDVDIYDFMWDPFGFSPKSCRWMLHRLWMSTQDVMDRLQSGRWNTAGAKMLAAEPAKLEGLGYDSQKYDEIWQERMLASGMDIRNSMTFGDRPHEIWEYHNGNEVLTVLDRSVLVQRGENPLVGQMPFHTYRPTPLQKQMVGIGEIEPIDSLSRELDTLRSMMLDAGIIAMCSGFAYDDAAVDEDDLVFGPASAVRVSNARPQDALWALPKPELPSSSYQNAQSIMGDIERVTGLSDQLADQSGVSTATEAQLVQASLSRRVELKSRRFEIEVCRSSARAFLKLNQRMITDDREQRLPQQGQDPSQAMQTGAWRYVQLGPMELAGEFLVMAEGGTLAAENVQQNRNDAIQLGNLFGDNPHVDPRWLVTKQLRLMGEKHPNEALTAEAPPLSPVVLQVLQQLGTPEETISKAVGIAQRMQPLLGPGQQGMPPTADQVAAAA